MPRVLSAYGTTEGQTARIVHHIADAGRELGHVVDVVHVTEVAYGSALDEYDGLILGASVHNGRYQRDIAELVKRNSRWLATRPSAFFSVSLGPAGSDAHEVAEVERVMHAFLAQNGWCPSMTASFSGAFNETLYDRLERVLMSCISKRTGGATATSDTSREYEYTDWSSVTALAKRFFTEAARYTERSAVFSPAHERGMSAHAGC